MKINASFSLLQHLFAVVYLSDINSCVYIFRLPTGRNWELFFNISLRWGDHSSGRYPHILSTQCEVI